MRLSSSISGKLKTTIYFVLLLLVTVLLSGCSSGKQTNNHRYTTETYDTIIGKWETASNDVLELKEDGTYWRTGNQYSEDGRYTLSTINLQIGDTYRNYTQIKFTPSRIGETSTFYYYELLGIEYSILSGHLETTYHKSTSV